MNYYNTLLAKKTGVIRFESLYNQLFETWINRARQILKDLPTGAISTVADAAELPLNALTVSVEAWQDLHGYDYPWVGGAGKNKFGLEIEQGGIDTDGQDSSSSIRVRTIGYVELPAGDWTISCKESGIKALPRIYATDGTFEEAILSSEMPKTITLTATKRVRFAFGNTNDYNIAPTDITEIQLEAGSTATTFEPYSNICPFNGWSSGQVVDCGKNLYDISTYPLTSGYYIDATNGSYEGTNYRYESTYNFIPCSHLQGKTVTLNKRPGGYNPGIAFYESYRDSTDFDYISGVRNASVEANTPITFNVPNNARYMRFTVENNATNIQIELDNQATTYEPYHRNTYTHAFTDAQGNPLTVYGAEWDVVSGELKQTDGYIASYNGETLPSTWISDRDVYASGTTPTTGAEVVYKLATPTTIPQTPLSIRLLDGVNNLYADCGEVLSGKYWAKG